MICFTGAAADAVSCLLCDLAGYHPLPEGVEYSDSSEMISAFLKLLSQTAGQTVGAAEQQDQAQFTA
jgi:hypothetical protein